MAVDSGNNGPVFLAPHAQRQLGVSIAARGTRQHELDVIGLGPVPNAAASRGLIYEGQLDPAFLRQIQPTIDLERGRALGQVCDFGTAAARRQPAGIGRPLADTRHR